MAKLIKHTSHVGQPLVFVNTDEEETIYGADGKELSVAELTILINDLTELRDKKAERIFEGRD